MCGTTAHNIVTRETRTNTTIIMLRRQHGRVRVWTSILAALLMMKPAVAIPVAEKQADVISSLPDTFPNASISENLLPTGINVRGTGGIATALGGGYFIAGLDIDNVPTLVSMDETGDLLWTSSIGISSPFNEGTPKLLLANVS